MEKRTIGTFLSALRKASGLTQRQLAEKLNVSDKAVSRWERDECAPDLSMIPVLAEIYGITSDEILNGQRRNPDTEPKSTDTLKADKQRRHLLSNTKSKFHIRSVINCVIAIIGLIIISICNFELSEANIGFLLGSVFFAIAIVSQIIAMMTAFTAIRDDDWVDLNLTNSKGHILLLTEMIISAVCILFAATLALAGKSHETVSLFNFVSTGLPYILIAAGVCFVTCLIINLVTIKQMKSGKNCLRLWCSGALSLVLIGLLVGQVFQTNSLLQNRHLYAPCDEYSSLKSFKTRIEEPCAPDGNQRITLSKTANGYLYHIEDTDTTINLDGSDIFKQLIEKEVPSGYNGGSHFSAEYGYEFEHLNRTIVYYELSDTEKLVPIYTFTAKQLEVADEIALTRIAQYTLLYIIPVAFCAAVYLILRKKYE